ncbi:MAG: M20/M25/M40 family metallo-hydrolase [Gemmatimonadota bacterium]|nr:M20/M25/M40 family metallo-hydrolase [Gemmatimonadota bacterium]
MTLFRLFPAMTAAVAAFLAFPPVAATAIAQSGQQIVGFTSATAQRERAREAKAAALASPSNADSLSRELSKEPHMAGTPAQARTRDIFASELRKYGMTPEIRTYSIYMPHPTSVHLYRVSPNPVELALPEGPIAEDTTSFGYPQILTFNGYGAAGDATGEVVYVNYGLVEDYRTLDSLGISVKGKVVVARYGRSYRGIKAREAEKHGAVALIIYSDPADDGYARGDVYPEGPMRPWTGVQRGSVYNDNGDPTTPGYASLPGAKRVPLDQTNLPRIPVIPASYKYAAELLRDVRGGGELPRGWQGALPFRYHVGPGPVSARVVVTTDAATHPYKDIWDVLGTIKGSEYPDQLVMIGGHRDAWGPGAADNISGTVSVLEAARTIGDLVKQGYRPKRTIVFASWDAEEWGLMGSTEFVEQDAERLSRDGVAYINFDEVATGPVLGASGSPSLRPFFRDVTKGVASPAGNGTVYDAWRKSEHAASDTAQPGIGDPGGGSDFAGFYNHLGIPIADWGFGGPMGVYHSAFDSYHWTAKFGDPGFRYHAKMGEMGSVAIMRLADADIIPYDYVEYARAMRGLTATAAKNIAARQWPDVSLLALDSSIAVMERSAAAFNTARDAALGSMSGAGSSAAARKQANETLMKVERVFVRPEGLPVTKRGWFRNVIYAADNDNGYSNIGLPSINEAVQAGNKALTVQEIADLSDRFMRAAVLLDSAARTLRTP